MKEKLKNLILQAKAHKIISSIVIIIILITLIFSTLVLKELTKKAEYNSPNFTSNNSQINFTPQATIPPLTISPTPTPEFKFQRFPFDLKDIGGIAPIGEFAGINRSTVASSHFYGNYRNYVFSKEPGKYAYNVYVPADGEITGFRNSDITGQFRFNFTINNHAFYYLDHIQSLSQDIQDKLKPYFGSPIRTTQAVEQVSPPIPVKAGDILGQTGLKGIAWDWGVIDNSYCQDIIHPEHYQQDQCPRSAYDFFTDEMKTQIAPIVGYWAAPPNGNGLNPVKVQPILGQYAHDIKGTLSGGWFKEYKDPFPQDAFFVPDSYEPDAVQIRLGIPSLSLLGVWNKIKTGTNNTNPDPAKVTKDSGIVIYNLAKLNQRDTSEYGILLVKVNDDESITVETLANKTTPPANPTFSSNAITLKR